MIIKKYLINFAKKYVFIGLSYFSLMIIGNIYELKKNYKNNKKIIDNISDTIYSSIVLSIAWPITIPITSALSHYNNKIECILGHTIFLSSIFCIFFCIIP